MPWVRRRWRSRWPRVTRSTWEAVMDFDASRILAFLLVTFAFRGLDVRRESELLPLRSREAGQMTDQLTDVRGGTAADLTRAWAGDPRWLGVKRSYTAHDVVRLRGTVQERHTLAERGAQRLWELLHDEEYINALGALTGGQAVQMVRAGLKAIYLSGWQVAADANLSGHTYPDQSLYPANSVPAVVRRINNALLRADQIDTPPGRDERGWLGPHGGRPGGGVGGAPEALAAG